MYNYSREKIRLAGFKDSFNAGVSQEFNQKFNQELISATIITFIPNQKLFQDNQTVESHLANLKKGTMNRPQLEEESLKDFTKRQEVWELVDFIRYSRNRFELVFIV